MADPVLKLQILARAELAMAQIHARRAGSRSALFSIALVFLLLGLGMATLAVYHALIPTFGPAWAAFTVATIDMVIGIIVVLFARKAGPSENEEKLVREIRDMAYAELGKDIDQVKGELDQITADVRRIRSGISNFTSGATGALGPIVNMLIKVAKKN